MKTTKILLTLVAAIAMLPFSIDAQNSKKELRQQMQEQKRVFIISKMNLTETEEAAFVVLYNQYEADCRASHRTIRQTLRAVDDSCTEQKYEEMISKVQKETLRQAAIRSDFFDSMKKIMPASKIYKFLMAEHKFNRLLIRNVDRETEEKRK